MNGDMDACILDFIILMKIIICIALTKNVLRIPCPCFSGYTIKSVPGMYNAGLKVRINRGRGWWIALRFEAKPVRRGCSRQLSKVENKKGQPHETNDLL